MQIPNTSFFQYYAESDPFGLAYKYGQSEPTDRGADFRKILSGEHRRAKH